MEATGVEIKIAYFEHARISIQDRPDELCYACEEAALLANNVGFLKGTYKCTLCPIMWGSEEHGEGDCLDPDSLYSDWLNCKTKKEHRYFAGKIVDLIDETWIEKEVSRANENDEEKEE